MIALWMAYGLVLGGWAYLAALGIERGVRAVGWPTRWIWSIATAGAVGWPALRLLGWGQLPAPVSVAGTVATRVGGGDLAGAGRLLDPTVLAFLDGPLLIGWGAVAAALVAWLVAASRRLSRESQTWPTGRVAGITVRRAPDAGPAVIGFLPGTVVLPPWFDELQAADRAAVLLHETEHLRCNDNVTVLGTLAAAALMPWNLPLWGMLRRIRHAVEIDCDRRVVAGGVARRRYGELLLAVSQRRTVSRAFITALQPHGQASLLFRRITMLQPTPNRFRALRLGSALTTATLVVVAACETPAPPALADPPTTEVAEGLSEVSRFEVRARPAPSDTQLVFVREQTPPGGAVGLNSRPISVPIKLIVDGVEVSGADGEPLEGSRLGAMLNDLSPDEIERIEVIKGSAAVARFGEEAAGGVIQVYLKKAPGGS